VESVEPPPLQSPTVTTQQLKKRKPSSRHVAGMDINLLMVSVDRNTADLTALRTEMSGVRAELAGIRDLLGLLAARHRSASQGSEEDDVEMVE